MRRVHQLINYRPTDSIGGTYAYEIARQLAVAGDTILGLVIMDCRVPQPVPAAVEHLSMPIDAPGLTEKNRIHMTASGRTMVRYEPKPFPSDHGQQPKRTHIIWCRGDGSDEKTFGRAAMMPVGSGGDSKAMTFKEYEVELLKWFKGKREEEDFGSNGWEKLVGRKENIVVRSVPGGKSSKRCCLAQRCPSAFASTDSRACRSCYHDGTTGSGKDRRNGD